MFKRIDMDNKSPIEIPAFQIREATIDDVDSMTNLHCSSFKPEDHIPVIFGRDYVKANYQWLVTNNDAYALVAESNGKVIGQIAVCDRSYTIPMFISCLPQLVKSLFRTPSLIINTRLWKRMFRTQEVKSSIAKKIAGLPGIAQITIGAVDANFRGHNIFPQLISSTKHYSKLRGTKAIRVGIYKNNIPSRKAFIKEGWIETHELETHDTVFYMIFLDKGVVKELGLNFPEN